MALKRDNQKEHLSVQFFSDIVAEMISDISNRVDELKWYRDEPTIEICDRCRQQIEGLLDCLYEFAENINNWRIR